MVGGSPTNVAEYCVTSYNFLRRNNISISYLKRKNSLVYEAANVWVWDRGV